MGVIAILRIGYSNKKEPPWGGNIKHYSVILKYEHFSFAITD